MPQQEKKPRSTAFREHRMIDTSLIHIDEAYQREISPTHVDRIASKFDHSLFGRLEVDRRIDGTYVVVDGQHRLRAAIKIGIRTVPCGVLESQDLVQESKEFVEFNRTRRTVGGVDLFRARLAAGEPDALEIHEIIRECGYSITKNSTSKASASVVSFETVYRKYGNDCLEYALRTFSKAYSTERLQGFLVVALGRFHAIYSNHPVFESSRLAHVLGNVPIPDIKRRTSERSRNGGVTGEGAAYILLSIYNRNLKDERRLPYDLLG